MEDEKAAIDAVAAAVDRVTHKGRFAEYELTNGIVLRLKPVPPLLIQAVNNEFAPVAVPTVFLEDKGRKEENPNDPTYLKSVEEQEERQNLAIQDLVFAVGTEVISVPDGYFKPEEDGWIASVEFANKITGGDLKIERDDPLKRYLYWLRFYALETTNDVVLVNSLPNMLAGIRENEVEDLINSFRGVPERGTDTESTVEAISQNGYTANRAARRARS